MTYAQGRGRYWYIQQTLLEGTDDVLLYIWMLQSLNYVLLKFCSFFYTFFFFFSLSIFLNSLLRISRRNVEVKEPWYDKSKYHTSKKEVEEPMAMPEALSIRGGPWCWDCSCCWCTIGFTQLLSKLNVIWTNNIACNWLAYLTGPGNHVDWN